MKAMLAAFVVTALIAVSADLILANAGFSSQERGSSASVRLDN